MNLMEISVDNCIPFENYPFKIQDNIDMEMLVDSIRENGVLIPIIVRKIDNDYEILSGHRRIYACKKVGVDTVPAIIHEMSRDEAVIFMVDANLQREGILPSEKGFAYKMKLEALKHQGKASAQVGQKLTTVQQIANASSDSKTQIQRYIRLTYLEKPLLDMVDEKRIALTPAVELSYLTQEEQQLLIETIHSEDCTPSLSQAMRMRKLSADGMLCADKIWGIMAEVKGNQKETIKIPAEKVKQFFKSTATNRQIEEHIFKALDYYDRYLKRQRDKDSR